MDIKFASDGGGDRALQRRYNNLYAGQLGGALEYFESEFSNLRQMITQSGREVPPTVQNLIERALDLDNLVDVWRQIASGAEAVFGRDSRCDASQDDLIARLEYVAEGIWTRVECNFAMHGLLYGPRKESEQAPTAAAPSPGPTLKPTARQGWLSELWWILKRGLLFLWNFRGIVFFGGYSYPERQSDGYFQRIQIVDSLFTGCWRVYVESDELPGRNRWFDRPEARVLVLRIMGGPRRRALVHALALIAVLKCRNIYDQDHRHPWRSA
jgi:hypothetical protein